MILITVAVRRPPIGGVSNNERSYAMSAIYQLVVSGQAAGQLIQNVLHYTLNESGSGTFWSYARELCIQFRTNVFNDWLSALGVDFSIVSLRAKRVSGAGGPTSIEVYPPGTWIGGGGTNVGNTAAAALLNFPVHLNGKNVTGKIFHAPLPSDAVVDDALTAGTLTAENTLLTTLGTTLTLAGGLGTADHVIYNRATQTAIVPQGNYVSPLIGTQRRRLHPI
jgi:hypothetical protein